MFMTQIHNKTEELFVELRDFLKFQISQSVQS